MKPEKYMHVPVFGEDRYVYAIQEIETKKVECNLGGGAQIGLICSYKNRLETTTRQYLVDRSEKLWFLGWLRITDEGSVPEMRIWSISLIKSDLKWCKHLSRTSIKAGHILLKYFQLFRRYK